MQYISWKNFVQNRINCLIVEKGGATKLAKYVGIDKSIISRIATGKYIPSKKSFYKWFGDLVEPVKMERMVVLSEEDLRNLNLKYYENLKKEVETMKALYGYED